MDRKKLQVLRDKVAALDLPADSSNYSQSYHQSEKLQKDLAAAATTAVGLLAKAKLVRGAGHQKKLVELADKLKVTGNAFSNSLVAIAALRKARVSLLRILKIVDDESRKVFIVHGRDDAMRLAVQGFLHQVGLDDVVLSEALNKGDTIIEKFDREARECGYAIVLFSPDDVGGLKAVGKAEPKLSPRARQNVILELGYFVALLNRRHVFVLTAGSVEMPSDFSGVVYEGYDKAGVWKRRLADELSEAGFYISPAVRKRL